MTSAHPQAPWAWLVTFLALGWALHGLGAGTAVASEMRNYRLNANDVLEIRVFQEEDLNTVTRVNADGRISLPLIGAIKVSGRTVQEAIEAIQAAYKAGYLVNPQVSILVNRYAQRTFTVLGQVGKPGNYTFEGSDRMTLLEAIGMAGGLTRLANASKITIQRNVAGQETLYSASVKVPRNNKPVVVPIMPGDVITVHEALW